MRDDVVMGTVHKKGMHRCGVEQSFEVETGFEPRGTFDFLTDFDSIAEVLSPGCLEGLEPPANSNPTASFQAGRCSPSNESAAATSAPIDPPLTLSIGGTHQVRKKVEANRAHQKKFRQRQKVSIRLMSANV